MEKKRGYLEDVMIVDGQSEKAKGTWTLREGVVDLEGPRRSSMTFDQPQQRSLPSTTAPAWPMPVQPSRLSQTTTTSTPFLPSTSPGVTQAQSTFQHPIPFTLPPSSTLGSTFFQTQPLSTSEGGGLPLKEAALPRLSRTPTIQPNFFPPPISPKATVQAASVLFPSLRRDEPLFTPETRTPAPATSQNLQTEAEVQPEYISKPPELRISAPTPTPPPAAQFTEPPHVTRTFTPPPERQPTPPPPIPTHEEILLELHRVILIQRQEAKVLAEKWYNRRVSRYAFDMWKSNVIKRGLEREKRSRFKRSVREMGLEGSVMGAAVREEEEELADWEEGSLGSVSLSVSANASGVGRRRSRGGKGKEKKRADDEETLQAIKEVCSEIPFHVTIQTYLFI